MEQEESKTSFLLKNLFKGLLWLGVILTAFLLAEDFILENFEKHIDVLKDKPLILFSIYFGSELVFGLIPPVLFMSTWQLLGVPLSQYVVYLTILSVISILCGILGYYIGSNFSKTPFYKRIEEKNLKQYNKQLRKYGAFIVFVGAVTPVPFSATCMLAGSVHIPFRVFILACSTRIFYFLLYGWAAWSFPNLFS